MSLRVLKVSELTESQIDKVRESIGTAMPYRLYFEAGLQALHHAGLDNRLVGLGDDGSPRFLGIRFDQSVVTTVLETLTHAEIREVEAWQNRGEVHIRTADLSSWKSILAERVKAIRTIVYLECETDWAAGIQDPQVRQLSVDDLDEATQFFRRHYPANVFSKWMVELPCFGYFDEGELVAVAGTHALDLDLKTAMIGNFLTHPERRGKGLGGALGRVLLGELSRLGVARVMLGTELSNLGAVRLYEKLHFETHEHREEVELTPRER